MTIDALNSWLPVILFTVFALSALLIKALISIHSQRGLLDLPNHRSMHTRATPTGGGLVIVLSLLATLLSVHAGWPHQSLWLSALIIAVLALIGWFDDKFSLPVKLRFFLFIALAILLVIWVGRVDTIHFANDDFLPVPTLLAGLLTAIGFIWLINLYNFMDGMDGLAGMQAVIAAAFFANWFYAVGDIAWALVCLCVVASNLGFLVWNWSPAKIFMGDIGSLSLGGLFAILTVVGVSQYQFSVLACALLLGVFVFDATYTFLRRLYRRERVFEAHRSHLYQRLAGCGIRHWLIVMVLAGLMLILSGLAESVRLGLISSLLAGLLGLISVISLLIWVIIAEKVAKK